jgi:ABC-type oligopeptide transport system substrate-binding subunit
VSKINQCNNTKCMVMLRHSVVVLCYSVVHVVVSSFGCGAAGASSSLQSTVYVVVFSARPAYLQIWTS